MIHLPNEFLLRQFHSFRRYLYSQEQLLHYYVTKYPDLLFQLQCRSCDYEEDKNKFFN